MEKAKRLIVVALASATPAIGAAALAFADAGGVPNENSCGGFGRGKISERPFACDDVGEERASPTRPIRDRASLRTAPTHFGCVPGT